MIKPWMFILPSLLLSLEGCSSVTHTLNTGAEQVGVYSSYPTNSCQFLGTIKNPDIHPETDFKTPVSVLQNETGIFLKNEGAKLGANVVVLLSHSSKEYDRRYVRGYRKLTITYQHSVTANAYKCTSKSSLGKILRIDETPLTKKSLEE